VLFERRKDCQRFPSYATPFSVGARRLLIGGVASQTHPCRRLAAECAASTCLTLFRFGKWQGNGNSKNVTASR